MLENLENQNQIPSQIKAEIKKNLNDPKNRWLGIMQMYSIIFASADQYIKENSYVSDGTTACELNFHWNSGTEQGLINALTSLLNAGNILCKIYHKELEPKLYENSKKGNYARKLKSTVDMFEADGVEYGYNELIKILKEALNK